MATHGASCSTGVDYTGTEVATAVNEYLVEITGLTICDDSVHDPGETIG